MWHSNSLIQRHFTQVHNNWPTSLWSQPQWSPKACKLKPHLLSQKLTQTAYFQNESAKCWKGPQWRELPTYGHSSVQWYHHLSLKAENHCKPWALGAPLQGSHLAQPAIYCTKTPVQDCRKTWDAHQEQNRWVKVVYLYIMLQNRSANIVWKTLNSKYFRFCRPHAVSHVYFLLIYLRIP